MSDEQMKLLRVRFYTKEEDYRPISWPIKHPYWCTGYGDGFSVLVAYVEDIGEIKELWPEAYDIEVLEHSDHYTFTNRFPCPSWFKR